MSGLDVHQQRIVAQVTALRVLHAVRYLWASGFATPPEV